MDFRERYGKHQPMIMRETSKSFRFVGLFVATGRVRRLMTKASDANVLIRYGTKCLNHRCGADARTVERVIHDVMQDGTQP